MALRHFAVVPTNGRECLGPCLQALRDQVDVAVLVWTSATAPEDSGVALDPSWVHVIFDLEQPKNISRWWNLGMDYVDKLVASVTPTWDVSVVNDDVIVPPGWFGSVSATMRQMQIAAACSGGREAQVRLHTKPGGSLFDRMQGFAFMLAGEKHLRADEELVWWCGDNDLDQKARAAGGMAMIPGMHVQHLYPNGQMTPELQVQANRDCELFRAKWGFPPF